MIVRSYKLGLAWYAGSAIALAILFATGHA